MCYPRLRPRRLHPRLCCMTTCEVLRCGLRFTNAGGASSHAALCTGGASCHAPASHALRSTTKPERRSMALGARGWIPAPENAQLFHSLELRRLARRGDAATVATHLRKVVEGGLEYVAQLVAQLWTLRVRGGDIRGVMLLGNANGGSASRGDSSAAWRAIFRRSTSARTTTVTPRPSGKPHRR